MNAYSIALYVHLLSLMLAVVISSLTTHAALRLRKAQSAGEAQQWGGFIARIVPGFSIATLGLILSGAYMTQSAWSWSRPWLVAALVGFAAIIVLGAGVSGGRGRALKRELQAAGFSPRAQRLLRDPVEWSARMIEHMLGLAVVFLMTAKPAAVGSVAALVVAVVLGAVAAVPLWRAPAVEAEMNEEAAPSA
jgi:hypothetical protein